MSTLTLKDGTEIFYKDQGKGPVLMFPVELMMSYCSFVNSIFSNCHYMSGRLSALAITEKVFAKGGLKQQKTSINH